MKIEIGESLMVSYLKHVKKCVFYQSNWKVSSNWEVDRNTYDAVEAVYNKITKHPEFTDVFKQSNLNQLLKQSEIDIIGLDRNGIVYAADIAFHEGGLSYGDKNETKDRVCKKLLRSYLALLEYFPNRAYELIFASPKVNRATEDTINAYFATLNNTFSQESVVFKYISNYDFYDEILAPTIKSANADADTNELFMRSVKLLDLFGMIQGKKISTPTSRGGGGENPGQRTNAAPLELEFIPSDENVFKQKLIETKRAKRTWYYNDGRQETDFWDASNFTQKSGLRNNINSTGKVRARGGSGLIKIKLEIL